MPVLPTIPSSSVPDDLRNIAGITTVMAYQPEIARAWRALDRTFTMGAQNSSLTSKIREEARRALAQDAGCQFCASIGQPQPDPADPREALAVSLAELIAMDHRQVDSSVFEALSAQFTTEEIVELTAWICFKLGSNIFGSLMQLDPATDEERSAYLASVGLERGGAPASLTD